MSLGMSTGFGQFLQDDALFAAQIGLVEMRLEDHVGEQLDGQGHMFGHDRCREAGGIALGGGIEIAADFLDRLAELARPSGRRRP